MRRFITAILVCTLCFTAAACRNSVTDPVSSSEPTVTSVPQTEVSEDMTSSDDITESNTSTTDRPAKPVAPPDVTTPNRPEGGEPVESSNAVDVNDKAYSKNPAALMAPMASQFDAQAGALRSNIVNAADSVSITGQKWYISNHGSDTNSGKSPDDAWATINALNYLGEDIKAGDAVLFERGGVYRGSFSAVSGVYYGAYGSGDKPCIYASEQNFAKASWQIKHGNIWRIEYAFSSDVGEIVFNHGESVGFKKAERYEMKTNGDFWCDASSGYTLYLYCDQNPAEKYKSIEIGEARNIITIPSRSHDVTIENLCLKYTGAHAVGAGGRTQNITVRNCEIGFVGGSYLSNFWRPNTRYGNGVEFMSACENILVENNWIYQIYDSGITHQGDGNYVAKNITFRSNLVEYCGMGSIEYWLAYSGTDKNWGENVTYADNIMRFAGYGWGGIQRTDKEYSAHIQSDYQNQNQFINFNVTGNIFDQSSYDLIEITSMANTYPVFSGNTFAQKTGSRFGKYADYADVYFDSNIESFIKNVLGDKTAQVFWY